jgi:hypothetical protein
VECRPVLYLSEGTLGGDYVHERRPWCEWGLVFRDGRLERCEAVRVESREAVADALRREGREVLDDDERLARLHFERARKPGPCHCRARPVSRQGAPRYAAQERGRYSG